MIKNIKRSKKEVTLGVPFSQRQAMGISKTEINSDNTTPVVTRSPECKPATDIWGWGKQLMS